MNKKKRDVYPTETVTYNVALACFLSDKIKGPTSVVAAVLLADIHRYTLFQQTTKRGYAALSAQHAEKLHPEFNRNTIISAFHVLERTGLVIANKPEKEERLPSGKRPATEYKLTQLAYQFLSNPEKEDEKPEPKKKEKVVDNSYSDQISDVLSYLNSITGKKYRATAKVNADPIRKLLKDGYTPDDLIAVIDYKAEEWKGQVWKFDNGLTAEASKYLRPQTLFNANKFENYLNEIPTKEEKPSSEDTNLWTEGTVRTYLWKKGVFFENMYGDTDIDLEKFEKSKSDMTSEAIEIARKILKV